MSKNTMTFIAAVLVAALLGCAETKSAAEPSPGKHETGRAGFEQENTPENLKAFMQHIQRQIHEEKDLAAAAASFASMIPDEARIEKALKDDIDARLRGEILTFHKKLKPPPTEEMPHLIKAEQTAVFVHGATTEEIIAYAEGSVAYREFPGGARRVAEEAMRPQMTFYEVEFREPGKEYGVRHHLFYWDGANWTILGPVWRGTRDPSATTLPPSPPGPPDADPTGPSQGPVEDDAP